MRPESKTPGALTPGVNDQGQIEENTNALRRGAARCCAKHSDLDADAQAAHKPVEGRRNLLEALTRPAQCGDTPLTVNQLAAAMNHLCAVGVKFVMGPGRPAKPQDVFDYACNPDQYLMRHFDVTVEELRAWRSAAGHVRCSALTHSGRRCNRILSPRFANPAAWVEIERAAHFCKQHRRLRRGVQS